MADANRWSSGCSIVYSKWDSSFGHVWRLALVVSLVVLLGPYRLRAQTRLKGLGEAGPVERVATGFQFVEGPAAAPDGSIYFSDIPANTIHRLVLARDEEEAEAGRIETFLKPSGHANGLMYGGGDGLLACQMDGRLVRIDMQTKQVEVLAEQYQGVRFNACNDLVIDRYGGIYFTDPRYRAPDPWPQGVEAFYYRNAAGHVTRLGSDLSAPNGIILSPDEKTLYVVPSMQAEIYAWPVVRPGVLGERRVLCRLKQPASQSNSGGDGLAVDTRGNLYVTSALGIQVISADGQLVGIIEIPEQPANCVFAGDDDRTLVITARTSVYSCRVPVAGHQFRRD